MADHDAGPHTVEQFLPGDDPARPIGKSEQDLHHLRLDAYRSPVTHELVGIRIDLPVADRREGLGGRPGREAWSGTGEAVLQVLDSQHRSQS